MPEDGYLLARFHSQSVKVELLEDLHDESGYDARCWGRRGVHGHTPAEVGADWVVPSHPRLLIDLSIFIGCNFMDIRESPIPTSFDANLFPSLNIHVLSTSWHFSLNFLLKKCRFRMIPVLFFLIKKVDSSFPGLKNPEKSTL